MASRAKQSGLNGAMHTSGLFSDMSLDGPEIGTLVVVVDRAKNLPSRRSMGKQDPYCAARLGKEAKKTNTDRRGGQTPRWDQELRFTVRDSPDYLTLKVSVFNDDKKTELIGENFLRLDEVIVPGGGEAEMWHTLNCRGKYAGEIRMELTYYDTRPKAEKPAAERRRERADTESPAVAGPRQPPVKRRPLPSDPNSAQSSPGPDSEQGRALQAVPAPYQTPPRPSQYSNEHTPASNRRTAYNQHQPTPATYRGPPSQSYPQHSNDLDDPFAPHTAQAGFDNARYPPASDYEPSIYPQEIADSTYGYPQSTSRRRQSNVSQAPYPMHDGPPVVSLSHRSNDQHAVAPLHHTQSEPIVPHMQQDEYGHRHVLQHANSESRVHDMHSSHPEAYGQSHHSTESQRYYNEPDEYIHEEDLHSPLQSSYREQMNYQAMQPSVEDDEPPPPPPPTHRNSAPNRASFHRASVSSHDMDLAPASLNITPVHRPAPPEHSTTPSEPSRLGRDPYHADRPPSQPYSQDGPYSTPERRNTADLMSYSPHARDAHDVPSATYSSPPDAQRRLVNHTSRVVMPHHATSSPASSVRASPYQTPPRGMHPLATQQSAAYGSSPTAPLQYSPADAAPCPLIKPRPVSPAAESSFDPAPQAMRPAVKVNMVRKSVPGRPVSRGTEASIPFGPDSFDSFNPNVWKPGAASGASTYSTPSRSQHGSVSGELQLDQSIRQSPYNEVDSTDGTPIHDLHGNVIDPSDRLPVDSWAPEPERKGFSFKPQITARERERLTGARSMGSSPSSSFINGDSPNELNGSFSMSTRSDISSHVSAGSSLLATVGNNRNKLKKKNRPLSEYGAQSNQLHGPGQNVGAGNYPYVNNAKRASYDVRAGAAPAPPIPAKVPLDGPAVDGDMDRLHLELASIDIGPSSNAMVRRPRRLGF